MGRYYFIKFTRNLFQHRIALLGVIGIGALCLGVVGFSVHKVVSADSTYNLSGTISFGTNHSPAGNITVEFYNPDNGVDETTITDSIGRYSISNVPNGTYKSYVEISGIGDSTTFPSFFQPNPTNAAVIVNGTDTSRDINFKTNSVTVVTKDNNGNVSPNASVSISVNTQSAFTDSTGTIQYSASENSIVSSGVTNASGEVILAVISGLPYKICATLSSGNQDCVNRTINTDGVQELDFPPTYTLSGKLLFGTNAVPAVNQNLEFSNTTDGTDYSVTTDTTGKYLLPNITNGNYKIYVGIYGTGNGTDYPTIFAPSSANSPIIVNNSNVNQDLAFNINKVNVTVRDSNGNLASNARTSLSLTDSSTFKDSANQFTYNISPSSLDSSVETNNQGVATVAVIPGLTYRVCATLNGTQKCLQDNVIINSDKNLEINFQEGHSISGIITFGANHNPAGNVTLEFYNPTNGTNETTITNVDGSYSIANVPDGSYKPFVEIGGIGDSSAFPAFFQPSPLNSIVNVNGVNINQDINFKTNLAAVTVKDHNGNLSQNVAVSISVNTQSTFSDSTGNIQYGASTNSIVSSGTTNSLGHTSLAVISGLQYKICATLSDGSQNCINETINSDSPYEISFFDNGTRSTITSVNNATTGMRVPFGFTVTTTGTPTPSIIETGNLPSGITFTDNGDGTGSLTGIPATGSNGIYNLVFSANNGIGGTTKQSFVLTVTSATSSPSFTNPSFDSEVFGQAFNFLIKTNGYPAPSIMKVGNIPGALSLVDNGNGTATLSATAGNTLSGVYNLKFKATNSVSNATQDFTLTITKAPVFKGSVKKTAKVDTTFSMNVSSSGYNTPLLTESGTLPAGLSFKDNGNGSGTVFGTPAIGSGGSYSNIVITASNAYGTAQETLTIKVNENPTITSSTSASALVGTPFSFQITNTGFPSPVVTKSGNLPNGITYHAATDTFSGTPKAGSIGNYPITVTAKNSSGSTTQTLTITVH